MLRRSALRLVTVPPPSASSGGKTWFNFAVRFASVSFAITFGFTAITIVSWPFLDGIFLPWCYKRAILFSKEEHLPADPLKHDEKVIKELSALFTEPSSYENSDSKIVVVTGPPSSGKSSLLRSLTRQNGAPLIYINCRGCTEPSTFLYATLGTILQPLSYWGGIILAYHKLFNAFFDLLTMNTYHYHVTYIIYAQMLQHLRGSCRALKKSKQCPKPILVVDSFEELLRMKVQTENQSAFEATHPVNLFLNILVRSALDENLFHVLILGDSSVLDNPAGKGQSVPEGLCSTQLTRHCPAIAQRANFRFLQTDHSRKKSSQWKRQEELLCLTRKEVAMPLLLNEIFKKLSSTGCVTIPSIVEEFGCTPEEAAACLSQLVGTNLVHIVAGSHLGEQLQQIDKKNEEDLALENSLSFISPTSFWTAKEEKRVSLDVYLRDAVPIEHFTTIPVSDCLSVGSFARALRLKYLYLDWWRPRMKASQKSVVIDSMANLLTLQNGVVLEGYTPLWFSCAQLLVFPTFV